jgi:hypothetical protein
MGLDFPVIASDQMFAAVKKARTPDRVWNEMELMASEGLEHAAIWKLSTLARVHDYFKRLGVNAKAVTNFIESVIVKSVGDTKPTSWDKLVKIANALDTEQDFIDTCKRAGIDENNIAARTLRGMIKAIARDQKGLVITSCFDGDLEGAADFESAEEAIMERINSKTVLAEVKNTARKTLEAEYVGQAHTIFKKLLLASGSSIEGARIAKQYLDGKISSMHATDMAKKLGLGEPYAKIFGSEERVRKVQAVEEVQYAKAKKDVEYEGETLVTAGSIGEIVGSEGSDVTVKFEGSGVIVTSAASDFDVISTDKVSRDVFEIGVDHLSAENKTKIAGLVCVICHGSLGKKESRIVCATCGTYYGLKKKAGFENKLMIALKEGFPAALINDPRWEGSVLKLNGYKYPERVVEFINKWRGTELGGNDYGTASVNAEGDIVFESAEESKEGKKADFEGKELETTGPDITIGKAVRIVGNDASAFYGRVGIVEKMKADGWIGINLGNKEYVERLIEDLEPAEKISYVQERTNKVDPMLSSMPKKK